MSEVSQPAHPAPRARMSHRQAHVGMKVGVTIPNHWGVEDVHAVLALAVEAEGLGFDSVWTMDHLLNIARVRERLEDRPYWHPMSILSALAAMTSRIALGTSVLVLPYHDPVGLAKYAATLDAMSRGRLILGVGVGALRDEFEALGIPMHRRGVMTDRSIAVMKDLWTNPYPSYQGGRFRFGDLRFSPRPVQRPHVPLWIGGASAAAIARTARSGDGWHPSNIPPQELAAGVSELHRLTREAHRDPAHIALSVRLDVHTDPSPQSERLRELEARLNEYRQLGVHHIVLALTSGNVPRLREWMAAIAREIVPRLREKTP